MTINRRTRGAGILSVLLLVAILGSGVARAAGPEHALAGSVLNVGVNAPFTGFQRDHRHALCARGRGRGLGQRLLA